MGRSIRYSGGRKESNPENQKSNILALNSKKREFLHLPEEKKSGSEMNISDQVKRDRLTIPPSIM